MALTEGAKQFFKFNWRKLTFFSILVIICFALFVSVFNIGDSIAPTPVLTNVFSFILMWPNLFIPFVGILFEIIYLYIIACFIDLGVKKIFVTKD